MDLSKANLDYLENDDPVKDAALTNIRTASELGVNPDAVAKSRQLASSLKLPEAVVHENMDVARAKAWTQAADSWLVDAPATTAFMADPQNAKVALDDVEALRNIEDLRKKADAAPWFSQEKQDAVREYSRAMKDNWGISKAYNAMGYQLEKVAPLAKRQLHNVLSTGAEDPDLDVELFRAKALAPESPKAENFFETAAYSAAELLPIIINFMGAYAAGGAAGGAGAALTVAPGFFTPATAPAAIGTTLSGAGMGAKIAGAKASFDLESAFFYADMNDVRDENGEPLDPMVKAGGAVIYGAGASVLELTGFSALAKILPGGSRLTKEILAPLLKEGLKDKAVQAALRDVAVRYAGGVSVETLTELGQEALSIITEIAGKQVSEAKDDTYFAPTDWAAQAERMKEVGIKTFLGTGLLGVGPAGVSAVVEGRQAQQVQTWRDQQTELHAAIQSSATMQRDPETMKAFGQILGLGEEAWIDAEALQQWGPEFLQRIGVDAGAVAQAAQDGSMIRLDTGRLMYEAEYPDLLQDLRPAPSALSAREAAAYDPVQALKDIEEASVDAGTVVQEVMTVRDSMRQSLEAVGLGETLDANWDIATRMARYLAPKGDPLGFVKKLTTVAELVNRTASNEMALQQDGQIFPVRLTRAVDPSELVFREEMQSNLEGVGEAFPAGGGYAPITAARQEDGSLVILDGHNRATVARERGDSLDVVEIPDWIYKALLEEGFDELEISYAMLDRAGESDAASALENQFPGAGIGRRGWDADDRIDELLNQRALLFDPSQIKSATGNRGTFDPADPRILYQSLSTRLPSAVKSVEDPLNEVLTLDFSVALSDVKTLEKNMQALLATPNMRKPKGKGAKTPAKQAELFIEHVVSNLLFLHDAMDPDMRARAKLWYDGGRKTIEAWAERYGISEMQGAALIAVLSPQNGWFPNVSQAERIADLVFGMRDFRWDAAMSATAAEILKKDTSPDTMAAAEGKTLEEVLPFPDVAARWIRVYDQTHNSRAYRVLTPEGGAADFAKTNSGADATNAWKSYSTIAKGVSILLDGRAENVYYQIGREHKVRNFYNNLFDPTSPLGFTTIDTHAVAAAMLRPLAAADTEVLQAFGGTGSASSAVTGMNGTYPLYLEAYKRAAEARGLLPREMQSITWEAVRGLFEASKKKGTKDAANAIWERYKAGEIEQEQAQQEIFELAGGVTPPSWSLVPYTDEVKRTYEGPAQARIDARGPAGKTEPDGFRVFFEVAPDPNDTALAAEWDALPQDAKQAISQQVAQAMVPKVLTEIGASGSMDLQLGGYMGATNPSMALVLDRPELLVSAAKLLGYALSQDSMMVVSDRQSVGTQPVGAVTIDLPDGYGAKEVEALYDKLWELEQDGEKLVGGHTTANGHMVILNFSNLDTKALADVIYEHLGGEFSVDDTEVFSAFIDKEAYQYGRDTDQQQTAARRAPVQGRADNLRNEATRLLREALDTRGGTTLFQSAPIRGRGPQVLRASDVGSVRATYGEQKAGGSTVLGIHYSREPRESLSGHFYGSGIKGAEARRLESSSDPRLKKRIHFYVDTGEGIRPEPGVGAAVHAVNLQNMYNTDEDPLGLVQAAYADKMKDSNQSFNDLESSILDAGFDGIYVPQAQGSKGVAVLLGEQHTDVPVDLVQKPDTVYQDQKAPRGAYTPLQDGRHLVRLFGQANASTMPHELAHAFLTELRAMVQSGVADPELAEDLTRIEAWLDREAVEGTPEWQSYYEDSLAKGMTEAQARERATFILRHEKFSRGFEKYLWEGKAPEPELEGIFARFTRWLKQIYQDAASFGVNLDPEIRSVFDRMMKAESEVDSKVMELGFTPMTEALAKHLGLGPEDRDYAVRLYSAALEKAEAALVKARNKGLRKLRTEWKKEAIEEAKQSPVHQMLYRLRKGRGINKDEFLALYGEEAAKGLPHGVLRKDGLTLNEAAFEHDFDTHEEMVNALWNYRKPEDIAAEVVEAKTAERDATFKVEDFILETPEFAAYQELMAKAYDKDGNVLSNKAFRDYAKKIVATMPLADAMDVRGFMAAMARHHKTEVKALKAGKLAEAAKSNKKARLNHAYAQEALNVRKRVEKLERLAKRLTKLKPGQIEEGYHKALLQLIQRFGLTKRDFSGLQDAPALADLVRTQDAFGADEEASFSQWILSGEERNYKDLTSGEFEELQDLMLFLHGTGKDLIRPALKVSSRDIQEVREEIVPQIEALPARGKRRKEGTWLRKVQDKVQTYLSQNRTILWIIRELDGYTALKGQPGPLEKLLYEPLEAANLKRAELSRQLEKRTRKARAQLLKSATAKANKVSLVDLPVPPAWQRQGRVWDFDACLSVMFNMGNAVNKQRVMEGYGLSEPDMQTILSVFSEQDAMAVQDIWTAMDEILWPEIAGTHKKLRFFTPGKVQAEAFTMPDGTVLRGGYYPLKYDPSADTRAARNQDLDKAVQNPSTAMLPKSVASGATKARAQSAGGMPVLLRTSVLSGHLDWAVHYASHALIIHDLGKVLGDVQIAEAIKTAAGEETFRAANELVKHIANPRAGDAPSFLDTVFSKLTGISAVYSMWMNRFGPLTQPTAIGNYIAAEGGWGKGTATWMKGAAHFMANPAKQWAWLMEHNAVLKNHFTLIRQQLSNAVGEDFRDIQLGKTKSGRVWTATKETVIRGGIAMYGVMDAVVSVPGWYGSYLRGLDEGLSTEEAMIRANKIMAEYTPMSRDMDKTLFQHTKGMARAWTYMMSYFTKQANTNAGFWKAWRQGAIGTDQFIGQIVAVQILPAVVVSTMYSLLTGDDDDRDNILLDAGLEVAAYPFAGLPFAREGAAWAANLARAGITGDTKKLGRNAFQMPGMMYLQLMQRAGSTTYAMVQDFDDDEKQARALMALAELTAASAGLPPVPKVAKEVMRGLDDIDDDEGNIFNVLIKPKIRKRD